jgi:three-Cys-motif partner protein
MVERSFGGAWTERKLTCLGKYLEAYRTIFTRNPRAKYFRTWYIDAFAGTGKRPRKEQAATPLFEETYGDDEGQSYRDGSAAIALGLASPFDRYLFIEKSRKRIQTLKELVETKYPAVADRCTFDMADANEGLKHWCAQRDWKKERAVVFLDPFGMQVAWETVEMLAQTRGVDLWYLFPLGIGVARTLTHDGVIDERWQTRLDVVFGTPGWRDRFYRRETQTTLFGEEDQLVRDASEDAIVMYVTQRLKGIFPKVAEGLV